MGEFEKPKRFDYGTKSLEISDNKLVHDAYFSRSRDFTYRSDKLLLGQYKNSDRYYYLDTSEAFRMIFIAPTRSGKTVGIQRLMSSAYKADYDIAVIPDVKNEFRYMTEPIQERFKREENGQTDLHIHPEEEAEGLMIQSYRPTFFKDKDNHSVPKDNEWASVDITDLERNDFKTLVNFEGMTSTQQDHTDALYYEIEENDLTGVQDIIDHLPSMDMKSGTMQVLQKKFENLKKTNFFESDKRVNPVDVMKMGKIPALNLRKYDSFGRDGSGMPQSFLSIWLRWIINARRDREINETLIINDETPRWIPASGDPSCKREFMESVDLDTAEGINYAFAAQRPKSIPDDLITQCRYIAIPWRLDTNDFSHLLKKAGIARNHQTAYSTAQRMKDQMDRFDWMIIDQDRGKRDIIQFISPIAFHKESED